jgi:hypothetical protein
MPNPENVKLGVCTVLLDNQDLGFTKGGVTVEVSTETHPVTVDQMGSTPIDELIMGRSVSATVPLAETTLENLVKIMPGATLVTEGGTKASGTVTFSSSPPVNNDSVTVGGVTFTFKTAPLPNGTDLAIPGTIAAAATALRNAILAYYPLNTLVEASASTGTVTITARAAGLEAHSVTLAKSGTNIAVSGASLTGGVAATRKKVTVSTGVSISLLTVARTLTLRPKGTTGAEDFTIHRAMTPGALTYAYTVDQERVFEAKFTGYADGNGLLFTVGDVAAA